MTCAHHNLVTCCCVDTPEVLSLRLFVFFFLSFPVPPHFFFYFISQSSVRLPVCLSLFLSPIMALTMSKKNKKTHCALFVCLSLLSLFGPRPSPPPSCLQRHVQYKSFMISCSSGCKHMSTSVLFSSWMKCTWSVTIWRRSVIFWSSLANSCKESGWLSFSCSSRE